MAIFSLERCLLEIIAGITIEISAQTSHLAAEMVVNSDVDSCLLVPFDGEIGAVDEHEETGFHQRHTAEQTSTQRQVSDFLVADHGITATHERNGDLVVYDQDVLGACHT